MLRFRLTILTILLTTLCGVHAAGFASYLDPIGDEGEAYDSMMERAAFLDVPRRDLLNVVKGFPTQPSGATPRQLTARGCFWRAWVLFTEAPDSSALLSARALALCDSARYPYDHLRFSLLRADRLRIHGRLAEAYSVYRDKLPLLRRHGDRMWEAKVLVAIGVVMQELGEYHEALRNYEEAERLFREVGSEACATKNRINIANIHYLLGNPAKALDVIRGVESNRYVVADSIYMANLLVSRFRISDYADSLAAMKGYEISRHIRNEHLSVLALLSMGILRHSQGLHREGIGFLDSARRVAERLEDYSGQRHILEALEDSWQALGRPDSAALYHARLKVIGDSLYHHESADRVRRAEHLATINSYERRIAEDARTSRWRLTLALAIGAALLVIAALLLRLMWSGRRRAETRRQLEEEENRRLTLLNRQYSLEIEAKEKELASTTLLMAQKNAQLKDLARQIDELEHQGEDPASTAPLKDTIHRQLTADDDWRYFKLKFEKVHPGFFQIMQERWPALSKTDLRLCAYIRVGMTSKEIAQVLSVKPDTVNTSRYRIRKKLSLPPDASLEALLDSLP